MRRENGHDPEAGRKIGALLIGSGFDNLKWSAAYETFTGPQAGGFAQVSIGLLGEGWANDFISRGWATTEDIRAMVSGWESFANYPGAIFAAAWCEAVAWKNGG
jgi:hypothetical protein